MTTVILSPHFDDAVLSCGQFMAASENVLVVNVFAGTPTNKGVVTAYDQKTGFENAEHAMRVRAEEDEKALTFLNAKALNLQFCDGQYGQEFSPSALAVEFRRIFERYKVDKLLVPLGLKHPDHTIVRDVALQQTRNFETYIYGELPSRLTHPQFFIDSYNVLAAHYKLENIGMLEGPLSDKLDAITKYESQTRGMDIHTLCAPELYWRIT